MNNKYIMLSCTLSSFVITVFLFIFLTPCPVFSDNPSLNQDTEDIQRAIVKIYTVKSEPFYFSPWMTMPAHNERGSGSIISNGRILTNAHVVSNKTFIQVRKHGETMLYNAVVQHISHEADLALLTVNDTSFLEGVKPLLLGKLPAIRQEVSVYGFPRGDILSVTKGIVSRVDHQIYRHGSSTFLAGQIEGSIHQGNSGGPVIAGSKLVGVVMQAHISERLAHMVPAPVIQHFLKDIDDGQYDGFPDMGLITQNIQNPFLKKRYNLMKGQTGVLINHVITGSPAEGLLKKDDILLAINGRLINDNGTTAFRSGELTSYIHYVQMLQLGDTVNIDVLRDGSIRNFSLVLNKTKKDFLLVPGEQYDQKPRYFIYGGFIFSPLTRNYINAWQEAPEELLVELSNWPTEERREVVLAVQVLPAAVNEGYHSINGWIISEVNGETFRDFYEFFVKVTTSREPFVVFKDKKGEQVVLDRKTAEETHEHILRTYNVPADRSPDLQENFFANYRKKNKTKAQ